MLHIAGTYCLALTAAAFGPLGELERALDLLDRLDAERVSVSWDEAPLVQVIAELDDRTEIPLRADWEALDRLGVRRRDEITLRLVAAPLSTILAAVSLQLGDEYGRPVIEAHAGQIVLTTREATAAMRLTDVYDVRDLLADEDTLRRLREETRPAEVPEEAEAPEEDEADPEPAAGEDEPPPAGDDQPPDEAEQPRRTVTAPSIDDLLRDAPPPVPATPGEELMMLIAEHVDPEAWLDMGGSRARIGERDGVLLVTAPPTTHRKFADALARLRRAIPSSVLIEAAIVDLPRASFQQLAGRYDKSSAALGRSILLAEDLHVRWQAVSAVALDQALAVESEDEGVAVSLALTPHLDRETGILSLQLDAASTRDGDRRSIRTAVTVPFRQGGAVLELPAASAGDTVRLLVLIPQRM